MESEKHTGVNAGQELLVSYEEARLLKTAMTAVSAFHLLGHITIKHPVLWEALEKRLEEFLA